MNDFRTDNRFCLIAGPGAAGKIDSFDDGNPNDGAFQRHPKSEKVEDYTQDIYCAYFSHPDFGTFQENLRDPEGFFVARWRTDERENEPKAADMLDLLDNVENPDRLVIRLPADPLRTLPWLQGIFKKDITVESESYGETANHKIRMEFDRYNLPPYLTGQLELYHGDMESRFADNATIGPKYLYRTGYFNLYDLREQQIEREASEETSSRVTRDTRPRPGAAADVEIVEGVDPADIKGPGTAEVEPAAKDLIPLYELFRSHLSDDVIMEFYEPLIGIERRYQGIIGRLQNPQFEDLSDLVQSLDARQIMERAQRHLSTLRIDLDALIRGAKSSDDEIFGGETLKSTFIVRLLTTRERIGKELGIRGDREIHLQSFTHSPTNRIKLEGTDGQIYFVTLTKEKGQKVVDKLYLDNGDGEFDSRPDKKFSSKKQREFIEKLGLPSQLILSLKGMPVRALKDYLSATMESKSYLSIYDRAMRRKKEEDMRRYVERAEEEREIAEGDQVAEEEREVVEGDQVIETGAILEGYKVYQPGEEIHHFSIKLDKAVIEMVPDSRATDIAEKIRGLCLIPYTNILKRNPAFKINLLIEIASEDIGIITIRLKLNEENPVQLPVEDVKELMDGIEEEVRKLEFPVGVFPYRGVPTTLGTR